MKTENGLFIPATELPPQIWEKFFHICRANGLTPREMICRMIVSEVQELEALRKPLLEQVASKLSQLIDKKINYRP